MGGGKEADDFSTDPTEDPVLSESYPEDGSFVEVSDDMGLQQKPPRTLVLVGRSGNGKSATGNSILGRKAFESKGRASGVTTACNLQSATLPNGQIVNVIDTPGLFSLSPSTEFTCREILNCLSLSKEGIDALIVVFSLRNRLTEEEKSALFALKVLFGSEIVDYMIVVFTNEDALEDDGETFEDYLEDCPDFKEILKACNDRVVLFSNKSKAPESQKGKQVQELLNYVEAIAAANGNPHMRDLSHQVNENALQEKKRGIFQMRGLFTKQMMDKPPEFEQLLQQMKEKMETTLRESIKRLEQQLKEEQAARLESEKNSDDLVKKLREDLGRANEMIAKLKERCTDCIIL